MLDRSSYPRNRTRGIMQAKVRSCVHTAETSQVSSVLGTSDSGIGFEISRSGNVMSCTRTA